MKTVRSLYISGSALIALGVLLLVYARPVLTWTQVVIEDFGYEFDSPYTGWSLGHSRSTVQETIVQQIGKEATVELAASDESELDSLDAITHSANLYEMKSPTEIHVAAFPLSQPGMTAAMISMVMQELHKLQYTDYLVLYNKDVQVDQRDAFRRMETYTNSSRNGPQLQIVVVTYVIEDVTLYQISLIEHSWLNLPRNLKVYNRIVETFHIH